VRRPGCLPRLLERPGEHVGRKCKKKKKEKKEKRKKRKKKKKKKEKKEKRKKRKKKKRVPLVQGLLAGSESRLELYVHTVRLSMLPKSASYKFKYYAGCVLRGQIISALKISI
jgi:hypothetical protein